MKRQVKIEKNIECGDLQHLPLKAQEFMKEHPVLLKEGLFPDPYLHSYLPIKRIVLDKTIMRGVWRELDKKNSAHVFLGKVMTDITFWGAADRVPLSKQKRLLSNSINSISDFLESVKESIDIHIGLQMCFEDAVKRITGKRHPEGFSWKCEGRQNPVQLDHLLWEFLDNARHFQTALSAKKKKSDMFPRKMNEASSYRTYLARCVSENLKTLLGKPKLKIVADVIQVMFDDADGPSEDHIRKLIKR